MSGLVKVRNPTARGVKAAFRSVVVYAFNLYSESSNCLEDEDEFFMMGDVKEAGPEISGVHGVGDGGQNDGPEPNEVSSFITLSCTYKTTRFSVFSCVSPGPDP